MEEKSMLALAGSVTIMRDHGDYYIGICPGCKKDKFTINRARDGFYCFGCNSAGLGYDGLERFISGTEVKCSEEHAWMAVDWFEKNISEAYGFDRSYLTELGIKDSIASLLRIGHFPRGKVDDFAEYMLEKGATKEELVGSHLAAKNSINGHWYSPYESRIVWPRNTPKGLELGGVTFVHGDERSKYYNCDENDWKCVLMAEEDDFCGRTGES